MAHFLKSLVSSQVLVIHFLLSVFRTSTERPEAIDKGDFIIAGIDEKSLFKL